jgi:hypothetical protein
MSLKDRIDSLASSKDITIHRMRVETLPNGLTRIFDFESKLHLTVDNEGKRRGGSLPLTKAQIRALTGMQV